MEEEPGPANILQKTGHVDMLGELGLEDFNIEEKEIRGRKGSHD